MKKKIILNIKIFENISTDMKKLGYRLCVDYVLGTQTVGTTVTYDQLFIEIQNPKMIQDIKVKELLVEYLI